MKIIPAIDLMNGKVVRLVKGDPKQKTVYSNEPVAIAKKWEEDGADMLHIVDLDATLGLGENFEIIKEISKNITVPIEVAGGIRDIDKISKTLNFAQRIVIGTIAKNLAFKKNCKIFFEKEKALKLNLLANLSKVFQSSVIDMTIAHNTKAERLSVSKK